MFMSDIRGLKLAVAVLFASAASLFAQQSNTSTVALSATVETALSISINNASIFWDTSHSNSLRPGQPSNPGSNAVIVTTTWLLGPEITCVHLYGYFTTPNALIGSAGNNIPASNFQIGTNEGAMQPVDETIPGYGVAALQLQAQPVTNINRSGTMTSALRFNIDLSSQTQLPADSYTGSLILQAEATI
jgi:hypothetical protein